MAVQSDISRISYAGNNSTSTSYAVPFVFLENAHLKAIAKTSAGVESVVTLTNHTGAGDVNGGTVRTAVAVPATSTLTIFREVPATQTTIYQEGGDFPAASHERALDKLTQISQQNARQIGSAVRFSEATQLNPINPPVSATPHVLTTVNGGAPTWETVPSVSTALNIPALTDATTVNLADEIIVQQAGLPRRATVQELMDSVPPQLPDATTVNAADELIIQQGGITKRATRNELMTFEATGATAPRLIDDRFADVANIKDFGAVGDGVADDSAAVLAALNSGAKTVDGGGLTYRLAANISPSGQNLVLQNAVFDCSQITTGGAAITFEGSQGTGAALVSNTLAGSNTIEVSSTSGFAPDEYAWLTSNTIFSTNQNVQLGQIVKIKSVALGTTITVSDDVLYDFNISAAASLAKLTPKQNITLRGVGFVGASTGLQFGVIFDKCVNVMVDHCWFDYFDRTALSLTRCVDATVTNTSMRYARANGLSYGVLIRNGCYNAKVANCYGEDQRHLVTVGGSDGVNLFVTVSNCHAAAQRDAGLDSHAAGDFILFDGNTIEGSSGSPDGIICQGLNAVISNNIIVGAFGNGIRHQVLPNINTASSVIVGNSIENYGTQSLINTAIYVQQLSGGTAMDGVVIANNRVDGFIGIGIYVYAVSGNVKHVSVTGNVLTSDATEFACRLRANASYSLEDFAVTANILRCSGVSNVYLQGATSPNVLNGTVGDNTIKGGDNGIRMLQAQNVVETGNYNTGTLRRVLVDTGSSNIWMDRRFYTPVTTTTATYTVAAENGHIICNRAGTTTLTLPTASEWSGREITVKTIQAQTVVSASSNVAPIDGSAAGTAILGATAGAWAQLKSDGTNWVIMQRG